MTLARIVPPDLEGTTRPTPDFGTSAAQDNACSYVDRGRNSRPAALRSGLHPLVRSHDDVECGPRPASNGSTGVLSITAIPCQRV